MVMNIAFGNSWTTEADSNLPGIDGLYHRVDREGKAHEMEPKPQASRFHCN